MNLALLLTTSVALQDTTRLTLGRAVDRALGSYPSVAAARAEQDRTAAAVGEARAAWLPTVSLNGTVNQYREPMVAFPLHSLNFQQLPFFDRTLVQSSVSLAYTLFDFGGRTAGVRAARAQRGAADAALSAAEQELVTHTATSYLRVLTSREVLAAEDQRLAALAAEAARAESLEAAGKAARVEVLRAQAALSSARADRLASAGDLDVAEHELAQLIALPYPTIHAERLATVRIMDREFAADTGPAARASVVERARVANPALVEAERHADAAAAAVGVARAAQFPQLQLTGAFIDQGSPHGVGHYDAQWQVGVGLSYPLFTGGARGSAIARADAEARGSREQVRLTDFATEQQVDRALAALREAHARVVALETVVAQSAEVARIERLSRDVGRGTQTDYLEAEADLLRARSSLIEARHAEISARIELARVTGELSPTWLGRAVESAP